ncbi:flagellar hook-associated protein 1 FlgK [Rhizobium sp. SG_E_25_P2]|jgi:flagellar hook-associated protein 1|uniref:flagellar hook-associated protein FlgK n=1 Tax=Rhizobium sp. SG_E_25_P2 TaxID=2879942 RepID=UPI002473A170|nr:flagellar hook-associated protein FlgK [Rhizobium sp. SG_E_25_P2]MDH6266462.1 flagellar hook-associated protein 1 FlgK [Rhizobium sp. SG_E_25_P2]
MSLSSAITTAQTIFSNTGLQTSALSTNIANASNPDYSRRVGILTLDSNGAQVLKIQRAADNGLVKQSMSATSEASAQETIDQKLTDIRTLLGGNDYETAPSTYISKLRDDLQAYATKPNESTLASTVVSSAQDAANSLNSISQEIQGMRGTIDQEIDDQVEELNNLLTQFKTVNDAVRQGTANGVDINNELDARDSYLRQISEIIGVRSFTRENNDMVLYTSDGTMLFDGSPREIIFTATPAYGADTIGNPLIVDGAAMEAGNSGNSTANGSLAALLQVRDSIIPTYQDQLDETARGLIQTFAQVDQTDGGQDDLPGLFTWTGYTAGDTIPDGTEIQSGLAASIKVNDALVKTKDGDPTLLRDGGYDVDDQDVSSTDYLGNADGDASYSEILDGLVSSISADQTFNEDAYLDTEISVVGFANASIGWLEQLVSQSATAKENKDAQLTRVTEALSNTTGVSLDEEMSLMLDLEQSYKASSKLVTAVDEMLKSLLDAV